nr:uncharacterized protein LOC129438634 [Misgurnus anguillicaudatus]
MFAVSASSVVLLFLLHHTTLNTVDGQIIDSNTLARIIAFFEQTYKRFDENKTERQYAIAINVPMNQCEAGFKPSTENFLTKEIPEDVKNSFNIEEYPVYQGEQLIAAGVIWRKRYTMHSERLLLNPTPERPTTPMQNLLNKRQNYSCTVFFTLDSPCSTVCLDKNNPYNILNGLKTWSQHRGIKVFVFKNFWDKDLNQTREVLEGRYREIINNVPLYRCENENECHACGGQNNAPINEHCLPSPKCTFS